MLAKEWVDDFRCDAIEASCDLVQGRNSSYPLDAKLSVCLPTENSRSAMWAGLALIICSVLLAIIFGIASFGVFKWQGRLPEESREGIWQIVAITLFFLATSCMFIPLKGGGLAIRPFLGRRLSNLKFDPNISGIKFISSVEDPQTFSKIKVISEDTGYIAYDSVNQRIIIEGVLCRYIIHSKDIVKLSSEFEASSPGTQIEYRIGDKATLAIVVEQMTLLDETIRQITGRKRNRGFEKVCLTLGLDAAKEAEDS